MRVDANMKGALARSVVGVMSVAVDEGQSHVYRTQFARATWTAHARDNVAREVTRLTLGE